MVVVLGAERGLWLIRDDVSSGLDLRDRVGLDIRAGDIEIFGALF
jgi:hypothetical protein